MPKRIQIIALRGATLAFLGQELGGLLILTAVYMLPMVLLIKAETGRELLLRAGEM